MHFSEGEEKLIAARKKEGEMMRKYFQFKILLMQEIVWYI